MNPIPPLVSPSWLATNLDRPELLIIDCRFQLDDPNLGYQQYLANHIQNAFYLDLDRDLSAPVARHGGRHPLPHPETLTTKLSSLGVISGQTHVIAYDASRFAFASRLWWLLRYLGHEQVSILDGGWQNWLKAGYPVSNQIPVAQSGAFIPQPQRDWVLTIEEVKARKEADGVVLIDAREGDRYRGEREPIDPIAGHIEGALNYPWLEVTDSQGFCQPLSLQQQRWQERESDREMILYCGSGVTACVNILSLTLAGYDNVKLYSGGWSDWCSYLI
jgi:thiosulfate/3-mercaptopyruvate sulfurtransferase